jgi:hypothetical protein
LPKFITREPPPCIWFMRKIQNAKNNRNGRMYVRSESRLEPPLPLTSVGMSFRSSLLKTCAWTLSESGNPISYLRPLFSLTSKVLSLVFTFTDSSSRASIW